MLKKTRFILGAIALAVLLGLTAWHFSASIKEGDNTSISSTSLFTSSMVDAQAKAQNLSQYQGKVIVLNFWATWCPPCRDEMPELSALQQTYQGKNLVVLGVAVDELDLVKEFLQTSPVTYPILIADYAGTELSSKLGNDHGILPYTVIIDKDGKIVETYLGRISKSMLEPVITPLLTR